MSVTADNVHSYLGSYMLESGFQNSSVILGEGALTTLCRHKAPQQILKKGHNWNFTCIVK